MNYYCIVFLFLIYSLVFSLNAYAGIHIEHIHNSGINKLHMDLKLEKDGDEDENSGRSLVRIFGSGNLEAKRKTGDVVLVFSEGTIDGEVERDCVVIGGKIHLKGDSVIRGDLVTVFSSIDKSSSARVCGDEVNILSYDTSGIPNFIHGVFSSWDILLALILILFSWKYVNSLSDRFSVNPASGFITGFLMLIAFIPIVILLLVTIVGIFLIPLLPVIYITGFAFGFAIVANLLGDKIAHLTSRNIEEPLKSAIGLMVLLMLFKVIGWFPLLGGLTVEVIKMIIRTMGFGVFFGVIWERYRRKKDI